MRSFLYNTLANFTETVTPMKRVTLNRSCLQIQFCKISIFGLIFLLGPHLLLAHPVSFKSSTGIMSYQSPIISHSQLNYSFEYWFAGGIHHIRRPNMSDRSATLASANLLLKRWNGDSLQANIYLSLGAGHSELGPQPITAGLGALQFDIEDRDYYFLAKHTLIGDTKRFELSQSVLRIGLSPYVEDYDGIHSWLIVEWQSTNFYDGRDLVDVTPFLRVFYKNLLFEVGQSFDGITKFNYIAHF